jgi:hypothetical protein
MLAATADVLVVGIGDAGGPLFVVADVALPVVLILKRYPTPDDVVALPNIYIWLPTMN